MALRPVLRTNLKHILTLELSLAQVRPAVFGGEEWWSKALALIWYRALTRYSSPARPFAAPDDSLLVTGQQGSPFPACRPLSRARNACARSSSEESTKLKHGTKLGPTLCDCKRRANTNESRERLVVNACATIPQPTCWIRGMRKRLRYSLHM